jgi:prepilin-type N-terminal cleavage/methylation domain-containing protein
MSHIPPKHEKLFAAHTFVVNEPPKIQIVVRDRKTGWAPRRLEDLVALYRQNSKHIDGTTTNYEMLHIHHFQRQNRENIRRRTRSQDGFTLLEILTSLGIGTIIFGLAFFSFSTVYEVKILHYTAAKIAHLLERYRLICLELHQPVAVTLSNHKLTVGLAEQTDTITFPHKIKACSPKQLSIWERGSSTMNTLCIASPHATCNVVIALRGRVDLRCSQFNQ